MKLLIFADTHGRPQRMLNVAARHEREVDAFLHLGDGLSDTGQLVEVFPHIPLYQVQGNCDFGRQQPSEALDLFAGLPCFYTHGHVYGVKENLDNLWWAAKRQGASAALYGHTHVPNYTFRGGIHLFNPGSLTMPRFGPPTYGLLTIADGAPTFEVMKYKD